MTLSNVSPPVSSFGLFASGIAAPGEADGSIGDASSCMAEPEKRSRPVRGDGISGRVLTILPERLVRPRENMPSSDCFSLIACPVVLSETLLAKLNALSLPFRELNDPCRDSSSSTSEAWYDDPSATDIVGSVALRCSQTRSTRMTSVCPLISASVSGVIPFLSDLYGIAPHVSSIWTTPACPLAAAK